MKRARAISCILLGSALSWLPTLAQSPSPAPAPPAPASASSEDEVGALRREVQALRELVQALQEKVDKLSASRPEAVEPPPAAPAPPPAPVPPAARSANVSNPAISAVFQAIGQSSVAHAREANGFDLSEAELALQSVVDPYAKMDLFLTIPAGGTPEVEEGYVTTLSLPGSLQIKGGRFKSDIGKWNTLHNHAFFTVDKPEVLTTFLGEESLTNDGLSASVLIPNPKNLYIESVTEVGTAREGPAFNTDHRNLTYLEHLTTFFNTSRDSTLEFGLTGVWGRTGTAESLKQALVAPGVPATLVPEERFGSDVQGFDATYKWKPLQMNVYKSFLWQTEILRSHRDLQVLTPSLTLQPSSVTSLGGYTYVEYQLAKRWRTGVRLDETGFPDDPRARLWSTSGVVRFQLSEFQELRFQAKHLRRNDRAAALLGEDQDDNQIFFEWIPVIGAHGAHKY